MCRRWSRCNCPDPAGLGFGIAGGSSQWPGATAAAWRTSRGASCHRARRHASHSHHHRGPACDVQRHPALRVHAATVCRARRPCRRVGRAMACASRPPCAGCGKALIALAGIAASPVAAMTRLHPYEYTYFNRFAGGVAGARPRYMLHYWGLSLTQASRQLRAVIAENRPLRAGEWHMDSGCMRASSASGRCSWSAVHHDVESQGRRLRDDARRILLRQARCTGAVRDYPCPPASSMPASTIYGGAQFSRC